MGSRRDKATDPVTETVPDEQAEPMDEYTIPDDDVPATGESSEDQEAIQPESNPEPEPVPPQPEPVKEEPKAPATPPAEPVVKKTVPPPSPPPATKTAEQDAGAHLVIAGNFLERANAEERVRELKKLGYSKAEVVNFELSEYHTACAGRYADLDEARKVAKKIKEHGIDTYVRHGN